MGNKLLRNLITFFLIASSINLFFAFFFENTILFAYDSNDYWLKSYSFVVDGQFNLINYPHYFRGFVYPFYLFVARNFFSILGVSDIISYKIFNSLFLAILPSIIMPYISTKLFNVYPKIIHVIIASILLNIFYPGLMQSGLTDMFALTMYLIFITIVFVSFKGNSNKSVLLMIIAGMFAYLAYNSRTIYLYSIIASIIIFLLINKKTMIFKLFMVFGMLVGLLFTSLPQGIINYNETGKFSISVPVQVIPGMQENLNLFQFRSGIMYQRYQTYIGENKSINPGNAFYDVVGVEILKVEGIEYLSSYNELVQLIIKYPVSFMGIYFRNFCNFLDNRYGELYVIDLFSNRNIKVIVNVIIILLFMFSIFSKVGKYQIKQLIFMFLWILPSLTALPGAPEIRFFISIFTMIYFTVGFISDYKTIFKFYLDNMLLSNIIIILVVFTLISTWSSSFTTMNAAAIILG